jgi:hypothetical protein
MKATFFPAPSDFRKWLEQNHADAKELWVGFYRKDSGRRSITWQESVDEALCFGWIDGLRKRIDAESYKIRFTPRRARSYWSNINIGRVGELIRAGRRHEDLSAAYSGAIGKLLLRESEEHEARQTSRETNPRVTGSVEVFSGANAILSAGHYVVGDECKERRDAREATCEVDRVLGAREKNVAALSPSLQPLRQPTPVPSLARRVRLSRDEPSLYPLP